MKIISKIGLTAALLMTGTTLALADPILGNWKTEANTTAKVSKCGSSFCFKLIDGEHAGKQIAKVKGGNGTYDGKLTDPADGKEYSGSAKVSGASMKLKGCALKVFCKTQNWKKI